MLFATFDVTALEAGYQVPSGGQWAPAHTILYCTQSRHNLEGQNLTKPERFSQPTVWVQETETLII